MSRIDHTCIHACMHKCMRTDRQTDRHYLHTCPPTYIHNYMMPHAHTQHTRTCIGARLPVVEKLEVSITASHFTKCSSSDFKDLYPMKTLYCQARAANDPRNTLHSCVETVIEKTRSQVSNLQRDSSSAKPQTLSGRKTKQRVIAVNRLDCH